jgi:hypothetical protein
MARWPTPDNPYLGRKKPQVRWPKASEVAPGHFESGGRIGKSTKHPAGLGDTKDGYLSGKSGSGKNPVSWHATPRTKRNQADYRGGRGQK